MQRKVAVSLAQGGRWAALEGESTREHTVPSLNKSTPLVYNLHTVGLFYLLYYIVPTSPALPACLPPLQLFGFKRPGAQKKAKRETIIPAPSYNIPAVLLGTAGAAHFAGNDVLAGVAGVLGAFLAFQATRVRFVFDADALEVVIGEQQEKSENAFVGGANRWSYDSFVNW